MKANRTHNISENRQLLIAQGSLLGNLFRELVSHLLWEEKVI
jgi:hypothetical protein